MFPRSFLITRLGSQGCSLEMVVKSNFARPRTEGIRGVLPVLWGTAGWPGFSLAYMNP